MAINFPDSPTNGQVFTSGSTSWIYDGVKWGLNTNVAVSNDSMPVGSILWYANTSTAPPGWIAADGSAVSRTTYATLFGIIGTTYGSGDGSTTFNVPSVAATTGKYYIRYTTSLGTVTTTSLATSPVGTMFNWPTTSSYPTGFLACDGSNVSRTSYADLFALIGTTYGSGDGSTTFTLPNMPSAGSGSPAMIIKASLGGTVEPSTVAHASSHIRGGSDIIDADRAQIDYVPTAYTRNSGATGAGANTDLTAHLAGIDGAFTPALVTSLPSSPYNGQIIYYQADATNGIIWQLRYNSSSASSYKWEFIGGSPITRYVDGGESWSSVGYFSGTTTVIITPALSGDYVVDFSAGIGWGSTGNLQVVQMEVQFNGVSGMWAGGQGISSNLAGMTVTKQGVKTGHVGGQNIQLVGYSNWAGASFNRRYLAVRPIRVG